jgi:FtsP/CotA-like multicopper oxidase with cupredoxin domain
MSVANSALTSSSHWSAQYGDGVLGPIIIDGPASAQYDEDLGALPITDWYYTPAFELNDKAQRGGPPPNVNNILVNGTHVNAINGDGKYAKMTVVKVCYTIRNIENN